MFILMVCGVIVLYYIIITSYHIMMCYKYIQWNLTIPATLGTCTSGWVREVAGSQKNLTISQPHTLMTNLYQNPLAALARGGCISEAWID